MGISCLSRAAVLAPMILTPAVLFADYTYQETTQLTGGSMLHTMKMMGAFSSQAKKAGDPVVSTVYIKGNRMAKVTPDGIEIIDLDKETMTHVDSREAYLHRDDFRANEGADGEGRAGGPEAERQAAGERHRRRIPTT